MNLITRKKTISDLTRREFIRRAACAAVGTAAMTTSIRNLRFMNAAVAQSNITDYKALVCIFLQGGNDSNNLVIPTLPNEYAYYAGVRTPVLAIPQSAVLGITSGNPDGHTYGLHPSCPELAALFGAGKLALMFNTGTLTYPLTRAQYFSNMSRPPQLFSHADQQTQWQTSLPDQPPSTGWGGRIADLMNSVQPNPPISLAVTLAGANTFEVGNIVAQYSISSSGAIQLTMPGTPGGGASTNRLPTLMSLLGLPYTNLQSQAYAGLAQQTVNLYSNVTAAVSPTGGANFWTNSFPTNNLIVPPEGGASFGSNLMPQLKMVARLIEAGNTAQTSGGFGMKRQIFFVQVGGYDLHVSQTNYSANNPNNVLTGAHSNLLAELSQSMNAFQNAMHQLGLDNNVVCFTASDFSRTFPINNSQGTDHGWGSHHLIMGGTGLQNGVYAKDAVKGGQTYGTFPTLTVNGPDDTGTGRWIPGTSTDQYFATLATWFGVDSNHLSTVFPNIGRFASSNLGFMG